MGQSASGANFSAEAQKKFNQATKCFERPLTDTQQSVGGHALSQPHVGGPINAGAYDINNSDPVWRDHLTAPVRESPYGSSSLLQLGTALTRQHMAYDEVHSTNTMPDIDGRYARVDTDYDSSCRGPPSTPSDRGLTYKGEAAPARNPACHPEESPTRPCSPRAANPNALVDLKEGAMQRKDWAAGNVIEVFSASANSWNVAFVLKVEPTKADDMLTVQYWLDDQPKNKCMVRKDLQMQPLGSNTGSLPPGFEVKPSQSRPGQSVFMDATTGLKYATAETAWQSHFERLMKAPTGTETIRQVSGLTVLGSKPAIPTGRAAAPTVPPVAVASPQVAALAAGLDTEYAEDAQRKSATAPASTHSSGPDQFCGRPPVPLRQNSLGPALTPAARPQAAGSHQTKPPQQTTHQTAPLNRAGMGPALTRPPKQGSAPTVADASQICQHQNRPSQTIPNSQSAMGPAITPAAPGTAAAQGANFKHSTSASSYMVQSQGMPVVGA